MTDPNTPNQAEAYDAAVAVVPPEAEFTIRRVDADDEDWVRKIVRRYWATEKVLTRGKLHDATTLPGFAAFKDDEPVGLITYAIEEVDGTKQCEIITHNSMADSGGIGSCLLAAVRQEARDLGCARLWLVTTNDNTPALRFYQRRDFDICAFYKDAVKDNRRLKPEIPDEGLGGIPLRHEIELEYQL